MRSRFHRNRSISLFLLFLALALLPLTGCDQIRQRLIERRAIEALRPDHVEWLEDGKLHVILCGTGSPLADAERAGPCTAVLAGGRFILVDVGPGSWEHVQLWRLPRARLTAILLTHFHSDHIGELGEATVQSWIAGRTGSLPVFGPPGVYEVVAGFRQAYSFDTRYRTIHHGEQALPASGAVLIARTVEMPASGTSAVVMDEAGLRVSAFAVDHGPVRPAYGYRFEYRGRSVVVTGDTGASPGLVDSFRGADLVVHDALAAHLIGPVVEVARSRGEERWAKLASDILDYHATPGQAVDLARQAGVRALVLTHLVPAPNNAVERRVFLSQTGAWDGEVVLGHDGMHFTLPEGTDAIERHDLS
jgi:ribonuclease Z